MSCCTPKYITGYKTIESLKIPVVSTSLSKEDRKETLKVRLGIGRFNYSVQPGLYTIGDPCSQSNVLVTANYKLTFDTLRKELSGFNLWLLVLDTKGINVWCAAGKGTFSTDELVARIQASKLADVVDHRKLILPQLGAPGVASHKVKEMSGFNVIYGPIRAKNLLDYLRNGLKATPEMRKVSFSFAERAILVPIEIKGGLRYLAIALLVFTALAGFDSTGYFFELVLKNGWKAIVLLSVAYLTGTVLSPILLPFIPFRSFALKGMLTGIAVYLSLFFTNLMGDNLFETIAWGFLILPISSFLTMNFTGASTYTSLSGVKKEMKIAVPLQIIFAICGLIFWILSRFFFSTFTL